MKDDQMVTIKTDAVNVSDTAPEAQFTQMAQVFANQAELI